MKNPLSRLYALLALLALAAVLSGCQDPKSRVVLYCAQDRDFAEQSLDTFEKSTGLHVEPKFDTEKDKSVTLYLELVKESGRPRCDVFWNNEILSTIRLQRQGLLEPYASPAAEPFPPADRADDHTWCAFATRARVLLVNTKLVQEADRPHSLLDLTDAKWKDKVVIARPQYGTSATQAACLFQVLGPVEAKRYYQGLKANGVQLAPGNKQVAEWVGEGRAAVGVTDTDDALEEIKANPDVVMLFPDRDRAPDDRLGTLFIPNTVALLRGCPNPNGGRKLIDYLLSPEVEARLAEADSHQIPLNPNVQAKLPAGLETPHTVKVMDVDFYQAADLWEQVQTFLANEFARPL